MCFLPRLLSLLGGIQRSCCNFEALHRSFLLLSWSSRSKGLPLLLKKLWALSNYEFARLGCKFWWLVNILQKGYLWFVSPLITFETSVFRSIHLLVCRRFYPRLQGLPIIHFIFLVHLFAHKNALVNTGLRLISSVQKMQMEINSKEKRCIKDAPQEFGTK